MYSTTHTGGGQGGPDSPNNRNSDASVYPDGHAHAQAHHRMSGAMQGGPSDINTNLGPSANPYYHAAHGDDEDSRRHSTSNRDSYVGEAHSPNMTSEDLSKFHSQGGAYTTLNTGHHHSEPSSPILQSQNSQSNDGDGDSNGDSSSNGSTKVDSRSASAYRVRAGGYQLGGPHDGAHHGGSEVRGWGCAHTERRCTH